jgi:hypothetical protein
MRATRKRLIGAAAIVAVLAGGCGYDEASDTGTTVDPPTGQDDGGDSDGY